MPFFTQHVTHQRSVATATFPITSKHPNSLLTAVAKASRNSWKCSAWLVIKIPPFMAILNHDSESQKYRARLYNYVTCKVKQRPKAVIPSQMAATCILDRYCNNNYCDLWQQELFVGKNLNKKFKFLTCKNDTSGQRMTSTAWVMFPVRSVPSRRMSIKL